MAIGPALEILDWVALVSTFVFFIFAGIPEKPRRLVRIALRNARSRGQPCVVWNFATRGSKPDAE